MSRPGHLLLADRKWADITWALSAASVFAVLSLLSGLLSPGFLEADGCTHYLFARHAIDYPYLLVDVWGRPLVTAIYALPAYFGERQAVRITSLMIALLCMYATWRVGRNQRLRWPSVAVIALCAQPLFFLHSFAELTELPFALFVILAFWAYQKRLWMVMTVLVAMLPLGRPEGFGFLIAAFVALLLHCRWWWIVLLPMPLVIWSWVGWVMWGSPADLPWWRWLQANWPYAAQSNYGSGPIDHYLRYLPAVVGPMLLPGTLAGAWWGLWHGRLFGLAPSAADPKGEESHRSRCDFVLTALPVGILLVHSVFWYFGKFSGGELRYLLVVAPLWALTTARGVEYLARLMQYRPVLPTVAVLAMLPLLINQFWTVLPMPLSTDNQIAIRIAQMYHADAVLRAKYPRLATPSPTMFYYAGTWHVNSTSAAPWNRQMIENPPAGVFMVYDDILSNFNSDKRMVVSRELVDQSGWVLVRPYSSNWAVYLSPRAIDGTPTSRPSTTTSATK